MVARILPFPRTSPEPDQPTRPIEAAEPTDSRTGGHRAGSVCVDGWGRDVALVERATALSKLRWDVTLGGVEHLPPRAGALIVINTRRFALAPIYAAFAIGEATGRPVRFVGRPDTAPVGALLRRLGGLLADPAEVRTALRSRQVVVVGTESALHPRRVGRTDHRMIGTAVQERVHVYPAATASSPLNRRARVEIGPATTTGRRRRGPLAELELADVVQERITELVGQLGGFRSGTPLDWIPVSGMGGGR